MCYVLNVRVYMCAKVKVVTLISKLLAFWRSLDGYTYLIALVNVSENQSQNRTQIVLGKTNELNERFKLY